jgi:hypothetical protein
MAERGSVTRKHIEGCAGLEEAARPHSIMALLTPTVCGFYSRGGKLAGKAAVRRGVPKVI